MGNLGFKYCSENLDQIALVSEGHLSSVILDLYDNGVIVEPAGGLSIAGLS